MDPSGTHNFEDQWRKALQDASETPPPSAWKGIEARLDQEEYNTVIPLWWQSRKLWYAAASVAAILLVAGLWFTNMPKRGNEPVIARTEKNGKSGSNTEQVQPGKIETADEAIARAVEPEVQKPNEQAVYSDDLVATDARISRRKRGQDNVASGVGSGLEERSSLGISAASEGQVAVDQKIDSNLPAASAVTAAQSNVNTEMLAALPYSELDVHVQKRYVFFRPETTIEEPVKPAISKEYWAGVGVMPASFNPDVKVKEAPQAFAYQALSNRKAVSGTSEAGVGYAIQTNGGMRLSKHWSVEMGVSYLKGNSNYQGGGYVLSAYNSQSANVLENAFAGISGPVGPTGAPSSSKNADFLNNGAAYIDVAKKVSNNYQYLQLPFQAGFTLNPDKRLSYSVLGGVMANFFLSNDLEAASGEIITTRASDEIYRSLNWAATTGLRFNYSLSSKWKASLTGSYQKAVSSGFRSNQSLEAHPYLYGVAWGVRYSF